MDGGLEASGEASCAAAQQVGEVVFHTGQAGAKGDRGRKQAAWLLKAPFQEATAGQTQLGSERPGVPSDQEMTALDG